MPRLSTSSSTSYCVRSPPRVPASSISRIFPIPSSLASRPNSAACGGRRRFDDLVGRQLALERRVHLHEVLDLVDLVGRAADHERRPRDVVLPQGCPPG